MLPEHFEPALRALVRRTPFHPFTVEMLSGARIEVDHRESRVVRRGVAVFIDSQGVPTLFDHESVSQLFGATDQTTS